MSAGPQTDRRSWFRKLFCWGGCMCRPYADEGGCGGQCIQCGKVVGYVTRAELRAICDRSTAVIFGDYNFHG